MCVLTAPAPFDFTLSTERFRIFGQDLATLAHDGGVHRVIGGREVRIEPVNGGVRVTPLDASTELVVRRMLGFEFDLVSFREFARGDRVLAAVVDALHGFRPPLAPEPFETVVTSITAQQVSLVAAVAIRNRLIRRYGVRHEHAFAFPTPAALARASEHELVALGFSRRKAEYVIALARSQPEWGELAALPDEEVKERLVSRRGLGDWTADWFLARHLARPRAWPAGDLALRKAVSRFYGGGRDLTTQEVRALGSRFDPFQNLTAHYLLTAARVLR